MDIERKLNTIIERLDALASDVEDLTDKLDDIRNGQYSYERPADNPWDWDHLVENGQND